MGFYDESDSVAVIRERIEELSRIRRDYTMQLGSSLYEVTKDDKDLLWGRESLYEGIAACDAERDKLLARIEGLAVVSDAHDGTSAEGDASDPEGRVHVASAFGESSSSSTDQAIPERGHDLFSDASPADSSQEQDEDLPIAADEPSAAESVFEIAGADEFSAGVDADADGTSVTVGAGEPSSTTEGVDEATSLVERTSVLSAEETALRPVFQAGDAFEQTPDYIDRGPDTDPVPLCPACGAPVGLNDKFCMNCGTSIQVIEVLQEPDPSSALCPNCGNHVDDGFKFCMTCGYRLR